MGRLLALDVGERRIGVAVSDPSGTLARPLTTIIRASRQADFQAIAREYLEVLAFLCPFYWVKVYTGFNGFHNLSAR